MPGCFIAGVLSQPHGGGAEVLRDQPQGLHCRMRGLVLRSGSISFTFRPFRAVLLLQSRMRGLSRT